MDKNTTYPTCGIPEVDQYCEDVLDEKIPTCEWTKLAVRRFHKDLQRENDDPEFNFYFEPKAYYHFEEFCENYLQHYQGHFAGDPIIWEPHQKWILSQLFGWLHNERYNDEPVRRFRQFSYYVAKKNGKSLISACIALYWLIYESKGTEVLGLATSMSHAKKLSYSTAEKMIKHSEALSDLFKVNKSISDMKISCPATDSTFRPIPTNADKLDGTLNSLIIADETKDVVDHSALDTLVSGQTTVISPLLINISTAGYNTNSVGYTYYQRDKDILEGKKSDDSVLSIIYTIDKGDEEKWDSEEVWRKTNPLFGVTVLENYYQDRINKGSENVRILNEIKIKNLNCWGKSEEGWIDIQKWDACFDDTIERNSVSDLPAIISVDLSSKLDLTNVKLTFVDESEEHPTFYVFDNFYLPKQRLSRSDSSYDDNYTSTLTQWKDEGHIIECGDQSNDFNQINDDIIGMFEDFDVRYLSFDPWHSEQLIKSLKNYGIPEDSFIEYSQAGYKNWDSPMKNTETYILNKNIVHNGNKVQRWCMENVSTKQNQYESIRPEKLSADKKIDGAVTLIMAMGTYEWTDLSQTNQKELSPIAQRILANRQSH